MIDDGARFVLRENDEELEVQVSLLFSPLLGGTGGLSLLSFESFLSVSQTGWLKDSIMKTNTWFKTRYKTIGYGTVTGSVLRAVLGGFEAGHPSRQPFLCFLVHYCIWNHLR